MFEATPEPGPLSPDYTPSAEPAAPAEPEGPPEWFTPYAESYDQFRQSADQLAYIAQQMEQAQQPQQQYNVDPFADDYQQQLDAYVEHRLNERLSRLEQATSHWEQSEGTERARDILADNISREGEFIFEGSHERALREAEAYLPEMQERYGATPQAAEAAINAAAAATREYERQVGEAFHSRQMNQLKTLNDAPREPGAAVPPAVQTPGPPPSDEMAVVAKYGGWGH